MRMTRFVAAIAGAVVLAFTGAGVAAAGGSHPAPAPCVNGPDDALVNAQVLNCSEIYDVVDFNDNNILNVLSVIGD